MVERKRRGGCNKNNKNRGGINKKARYKILEIIQRKKADKKNVIEREGAKYVLLTLGELQKEMKMEKSRIHTVLRLMASNGVVETIETQYRVKHSPYNLKAYRIADKLGGDNLEKKQIRKISMKELYPTRNRKANDALKIFVEETHQPKDIALNRRTFVRIATIMKRVFKWDFERFRQWCRWIYKNGKKNTKALLRSKKATAILMKERFTKIYNHYLGLWSEFWIRSCENKQREYNNKYKNNKSWKGKE